MCEQIVALAGNPNVGKSTVFNYLTGMKQHTGNWPGKTVEVAEGEYLYNGTLFRVVDLPGTYSLNAGSEDEEVARDFICDKKYGLVLIVTDATALERNLCLVLQILEITGRCVLCVNLMDEAEKKGIKVNLQELELMLGIPVLGTSARQKKSLEKLKKVIAEEISACGRETYKVKIPDNAEQLSETEISDFHTIEIVKSAEKIAKAVTGYENPAYNARQHKIDQILTSKTLGIPLMLLMLCGVFWLTVSGANYPSKWLGELLFGAETYLHKLFAGLPSAVSGILVDGIYHTLAWVVSVMFPPMAIFFPLFAILEDSGYLPRIAFNLDKCFKGANAHGRQALTMCQGFGCNACGVMGCRIINSPRERLIAILTNNFVPCNGRFPTIIVLISIFLAGGNGAFSGVVLMGFIVLSVITTLAVSKILSVTVLRGKPSSYAFELPPYRKPQFKEIIVRSFVDRTLFVLSRAVRITIPAGALIWLLANVSVGQQSILQYAGDFFNPIGKFLGMDGYILLAFLLGFPANEIVMPILIMCYSATGYMAEFESNAQLGMLLMENGWSAVTAICVIIFALMHFPCATTCQIIYKETKSIKWTFLAFVLPTLTGTGICALIAFAARLIGA